MPENKKPYRIEITPELIEKYLRGRLDGKTMHAIERQALDDPFLAEALEGYTLHSPDQSEHLEDLQRRLQKRTAPQRSKGRQVWFVRYRNAQIAAAAILLVLIGVGIYFFSPKHSVENNNLVLDKTTVLPKDSTDSIRTASGAVAVNSQTPPDATAQAAGKTRRLEPGIIAKKNIKASESPANNMDTMEVLANNDMPPEKTAESAHVRVPADIFAAANASRNAMLRKAAPAMVRVERDSTWIAGKVTDANTGESIPGVTVSIPGTGHATVSSMSGDFKMKLPADSGKVSFASIGYDTRTITAFAGEDNIAVSMHPNESALNETVVVGYGKKSGRSRYAKNKARPVGGLAAYKRYLRDSLRYPPDALADQVEGVVKLSFLVMPDSTLRQIEVLQSPGYGLGTEAIRLLKEGPAWRPVNHEDTCREEIEVKFDLRKARK